MKPALLLFDVDGTLLLSGRAGMRAMTRAFEETFGVPDGFRSAAFAGRTDSILVSEALRAAGLPDTPDNHRRFHDAYVPTLVDEIQKPGTGYKGLLPGVRELVGALEEHDAAFTALLTGNYRAAAEVKLSYFDLWDAFEWGVFSDDSPDRSAFVPIARERAETYDIPEAARHRIVVIGDTPHDVACARAAGAASLAVATGEFTVEELRQAGATIAVRDLADTAAVLERLEEMAA